MNDKMKNKSIQKMMNVIINMSDSMAIKIILHLHVTIGRAGITRQTTVGTFWHDATFDPENLTLLFIEFTFLFHSIELALNGRHLSFECFVCNFQICSLLHSF